MLSFLDFVLSFIAPASPKKMAELPQNISSFERVNEAASYIKERLPLSLQSPRVAIVCGTGLGGLVHTVGDTPRVEYDYSSIPYFPQLTGKSGSSETSLPYVSCFLSFFPFLLLSPMR